MKRPAPMAMLVCAIHPRESLASFAPPRVKLVATAAIRAAFVSLWALFASACAAQTLCLTFDDGLNPDVEPRAAAWNAVLIDKLGQAGVDAMVFPSLKKVGGAPGRALIKAWADAGLAVGNHTATHRSLSSPSVELADFIQDVKDNEEAFHELPTWQRRLRFPFLKEGNTVAKRDGMRRWLAENSYLAAPVSIDTSDWYYNAVYLELMERGQPAQLRALEHAYVAHLLDRARYYEALALAVLHRSPQHVMLLHVSALNAATIDRVIAEFRKQGWRFAAPRQAFGDDLYAKSLDVLPAGESIIWAYAQVAGINGLRYPGEDSIYEEPILRALKLLPE